MKRRTMWLPAIATASMLVLLSGCGAETDATSVYGSGGYGGASGPEATRQPQPQQPTLPRGNVPPVLAGTWTGGEGDKTGEYLQIADDGRYQRSRNGSAFQQGVIITSASGMVLYATTGSQQPAQWDYVEAGGIEVLSITYAQEGYFSYVRAG